MDADELAVEEVASGSFGVVVLHAPGTDPDENRAKMARMVELVRPDVRDVAAQLRLPAQPRKVSSGLRVARTRQPRTRRPQARHIAEAATGARDGPERPPRSSDDDEDELAVGELLGLLVRLDENSRAGVLLAAHVRNLARGWERVA
jgi:hypothetical protein